jgi:hypothetical protein
MWEGWFEPDLRIHKHCATLSFRIFAFASFLLFCFKSKWSEVKWSEVKWNEVKWSGVKWSGVKWSEVKWSEVKWSEVKWSYTEGTWLYCDYFIWCVSGTVVLTCVMCGCVCVCVCVLVMCTCIYCILYCLYCVLYRTIYVHIFWFVLLPPSENSAAVITQLYSTSYQTPFLRTSSGSQDIYVILIVTTF